VPTAQGNADELLLQGLTLNNGLLNLNNNVMFIQYTQGADPISSIAAALRSGYNNGGWNGSGIISTTAQTPTDGLFYGLGYADSADTSNPANLPSGTIEIRYTLLGDANLDGVVNGVDFGIVAANFNKGVSRWDQGDFNYDNVVNGIDFGELAANFNKGAVVTAIESTTASATATVLADNSASSTNSASTATVNDPVSTQLTTTITKTPKTNAVLVKTSSAPAPKAKPKNSSPRTRG
jgi:hypothetical protein